VSESLEAKGSTRKRVVKLLSRTPILEVSHGNEVATDAYMSAEYIARTAEKIGQKRKKVR
jgi:hypothetical protein